MICPDIQLKPFIAPSCPARRGGVEVFCLCCATVYSGPTMQVLEHLTISPS